MGQKHLLHSDECNFLKQYFSTCKVSFYVYRSSIWPPCCLETLFSLSSRTWRNLQERWRVDYKIQKLFAFNFNCVTVGTRVILTLSLKYTHRKKSRGVTLWDRVSQFVGPTRPMQNLCNCSSNKTQLQNYSAVIFHLVEINFPVTYLNAFEEISCSLNADNSLH